MSADAEESRVGAKFYRIAWIFYLALAIAGLLWIGTQRGRLGIELFVDPGSWWIDLGAGVAIGAALLALWWALRRFFAAARSLEDELAALLAPLSVAEAVSLALISAVAEELFFRGALQGAIGFLPAAVLFALMHAGPGKGFRIWTLFALAGGLALGALVALRGPLGGAIVAHLMVNGVNLVRLARRAPQSAEPSELSEPAPASAASDPDDPAAHE
ncbi:MAG: CPBP family intramembrane metalloprotease [Thermoanaerobaculia bacterium]|jgi:membrane protease YdiL (CAAX protease family)|nr:CPBP family intramembrane metalloprotease [Thermoanaerobaculia bacterium]MBP9822771.1 CPBP family intramembrane metalloprotease [Thermoanaerobaculia bacterium]